MKTAEKYVFDPKELVDGNSLELFEGGDQIFSELLALLNAAKYRIFIQIYRYEDDQVGGQVRDALVDAVKRGCEVKLIYDHVGSIYTPSQFFLDMEKQGVQVMNYHSLFSLPLNWKVFKRNHRKLILIDAETAMLGGFNFADSYAKSVDQGGFHDLAIRIEGPVCRQAWDYFSQVWDRKKINFPRFGQKNRRKKERPRKIGDKSVQIAGNDHFTERWRIRREILYAFNSAEKTIWLMNPYFLPDPAIVRALVLASKRGVDVKIVLPHRTDVKAIDLASRVVIQKLLKKGIKVFRWSGFCHGKVLLVDGLWSAIGSYNFDYRSLFHNLELMVYVSGKELALELQSFFQRTQAESVVLDQRDWESLGFFSKLFARILYRMRSFL